MSFCRHYLALIPLILSLLVVSCAPAGGGASRPASPPAAASPTAPLPTRMPLTDDALPTPRLEGIAAERREVRFASGDIQLAGELDLPLGAGPHPLVVVIHHSGPVPRDSYGYMAEILVRAGYAVFRFDKRGTGLSGGMYGCCEADDALAAYRAAVAQPGIDRCNVFIAAQSIGTRHLAEQYPAYEQVQAPRGIALLSNLLYADMIVRLNAPLIVIVADSEAELSAIGPDAVAAYNARFPGRAALYIAEGAEHTLFDIREGPIAWTDPRWVERYHRGAMNALEAQLNAWRTPAGDCAPN